MNTKSILTLAILVALAGCGDASEKATIGPAPTVQVFEPADGNFRVDAPVSGWKRNQESADMPGGKLISVTYMATEPRSKVVYVVAYNEFPSEAMIPTENREEALDNAAIGLIAPYQGSMEKNEVIKLGEFSGRQIRFDIPAGKGGPQPMKGMARVYLVNLRLYTITTLIPAGVATPPEVDRFFQTFTVTKK